MAIKPWFNFKLNYFFRYLKPQDCSADISERSDIVLNYAKLALAEDEDVFEPNLDKNNKEMKAANKEANKEVLSVTIEMNETETMTIEEAPVLMMDETEMQEEKKDLNENKLVDKKDEKELKTGASCSDYITEDEIVDKMGVKKGQLERNKMEDLDYVHLNISNDGTVSGISSSQNNIIQVQAKLFKTVMSEGINSSGKNQIIDQNDNLVAPAKEKEVCVIDDQSTLPRDVENVTNETDEESGDILKKELEYDRDDHSHSVHSRYKPKIRRVSENSDSGDSGICSPTVNGIFSPEFNKRQEVTSSQC